MGVGGEPCSIPVHTHRPLHCLCATDESFSSTPALSSSHSRPGHNITVLFPLRDAEVLDGFSVGELCLCGWEVGVGRGVDHICPGVIVVEEHGRVVGED